VYVCVQGAIAAHFSAWPIRWECKQRPFWTLEMRQRNSNSHPSNQNETRRLSVYPLAQEKRGCP